MTHLIQLNDDDLSNVERVRRKYVQNGMTYGWKANVENPDDQGHWNRRILNNSKLFPFDHASMPYIDKHPEIKELWEIVQEVVGDRALLRCYTNGYTYGTDGYAHVDDPWIQRRFGSTALSETAILYLNPEWNRDWAGETVLYNDKDDVELSILPKEGRLFIFDSSKAHAARPVSRICKVLRSVLVFKTFDPKHVSQEVKFIHEQTRNHQHSGKTFFEHLFNTMLILEEQKLDTDIVLAGLYHSVYGTEFYKYNSPSVSREKIISIIGERAEGYVYEFCSLTNRFDKILNNTNNYNHDTWYALLNIEGANLFEQNTDDRYRDRLIELSNKLREIHTHQI
jgi:hypothetical protein